MSADVLVRRGRTVLDADGRLRGRLDAALDEVWGWVRSATAACMARLGPALVVTSPLTRARQTALAVGTAAVCDGGTGEPVLVLVANDVVNRLLLHDLAPGLGPVEAVPQGTGCWNVLGRDHGSWRVPGVGQRELALLEEWP